MCVPGRKEAVLVRTSLLSGPGLLRGQRRFRPGRRESSRRRSAPSWRSRVDSEGAGLAQRRLSVPPIRPYPPHPPPSPSQHAACALASLHAPASLAAPSAPLPHPATVPRQRWLRHGGGGASTRRPLNLRAAAAAARRVFRGRAAAHRGASPSPAATPSWPTSACAPRRWRAPGVAGKQRRNGRGPALGAPVPLPAPRSRPRICRPARTGRAPVFPSPVACCITQPPVPASAPPRYSPRPTPPSAHPARAPAHRMRPRSAVAPPRALESE